MIMWYGYDLVHLFQAVKPMDALKWNYKHLLKIFFKLYTTYLCFWAPFLLNNSASVEKRGKRDKGKTEWKVREQ